MIKFLIEKEFKQLFRNSFLPKLIFIFPCMIMILMPWAANLVYAVKDVYKRQHAHGGGLACPVGSQETENLAPMDLEGLTKRFGNFTAVDHITLFSWFSTRSCCKPGGQRMPAKRVRIRSEMCIRDSQYHNHARENENQLGQEGVAEQLLEFLFNETLYHKPIF